MSAEHRSCGIGAFLPMSCRGRAEAFARRLQTRLHHLGGTSDTDLGDSEESWLTSQSHHYPTLHQPRHSTSSESDVYYDFDLESPGSPPEEASEADLKTIMLNGGGQDSESGCVSAVTATSPGSDSSDGNYYDPETFDLPQDCHNGHNEAATFTSRKEIKALMSTVGETKRRTRINIDGKVGKFGSRRESEEDEEEENATEENTDCEAAQDEEKHESETESIDPSTDDVTEDEVESDNERINRERQMQYASRMDTPESESTDTKDEAKPADEEDLEAVANQRDVQLDSDQETYRSTFVLMHERVVECAPPPTPPSTPEDPPDEVVEDYEEDEEEHEEVVENLGEVVESSEEVAQNDVEVVEVNEEVVKHREEIVEHSEAVIEVNEEVVEHTDEVVEHSDEVVEHSDEVVEHSDEVVEHSDEVVEHNEEVVQNDVEVVKVNEKVVEHQKPATPEKHCRVVVLEATPTRDDDDEEEEGMRPQRVQRCSSLKTGKTPPGTPGRKKIVRFADVLGLDLADVRTFLDEIPKVPTSAYEDLPNADLSLGNNMCRGLTQHPLPRADRAFMPLFQQPGGSPNFLDRVRQQYVCLENAMVKDMVMCSIAGTVRVINLDFNKSVHIRYSLDGWRTYADLQATYVNNSCDGFSDKFTFTIYAHTLVIGQRLEFAVRFQCHGVQYWDSNGGVNYIFQCLPPSTPQPFLSLSTPEGDRWASFY